MNYFKGICILNIITEQEVPGVGRYILIGIDILVKNLDR